MPARMLLTERRGSGGFGFYDPLFLTNESDSTFAGDFLG